MKREIVCSVCEKKLRDLFPNNSPYPGEHVKFVNGIALEDYTCDHGGESIPKDTPCCAVSMWADYGGTPYYPWESECITIVN